MFNTIRNIMSKLKRGQVRSPKTVVRGILFKILFDGIGKAVVKDLFDTENQIKALELVRQLAKRENLTTVEKAAEFNRLFLKWAKAGGKAIRVSIVNCLREMAVSAFKTEKNA